MAHLLLHGTLDVIIFEANHFNYNVPKFVEAIQPQNSNEPPRGLPRMYATVDLNRARVGRTRLVHENPANPQWNESFHIYCAHFSSDIVFSIKLWQPVNALLVGRAYLPVRDVLGGQEVDRWLYILNADKKPLPDGPKIHVRVQFMDVAADRHGWGGGVGDAGYPGVPYTFFKQRPGCRVTLYQDAHTPDTFQPKIPLAGGRFYEPGRCWEHIYDAISDTRHLVYITGWSVYPEITLVRDGNRHHPGGGTTIGELLKRKAREGVRVVMLVWDDPTSLLNFGILPSFMGTNDASTLAYLRGSTAFSAPATVTPAAALSRARRRPG